MGPLFGVFFSTFSAKNSHRKSFAQLEAKYIPWWCRQRNSRIDRFITKSIVGTIFLVMDINRLFELKSGIGVERVDVIRRASVILVIKVRSHCYSLQNVHFWSGSPPEAEYALAAECQF